MLLATFALGALLSTPAAGAAPWYASPACTRANEQLFSGAFSEVKAFVKAASASADPDEKACGLWLSASMTETQLALFGDGAVRPAEQRARLDRLSAFAQAHPTEPRFSDLRLEASLRRVRMLLRQGERSAAVREARAAEAALKARRKLRKITPTYMYAEAVSNLAVAHSEWLLRTILGMAGLSGDAARGKKALDLMRRKKSVYQPGAEYLARSFAEAKPDGVLGAPLPYSKRLYHRYPAHPQMAFDYSVDLAEAGRCAQVPAVIQPLLEQLKARPGRWSARVRTKLRWIMGRCAKARGDLAAAKRWAEAARAEVTPDTKERVESLLGSL